MHPKDRQREVKKLVDGLSDIDMRELCLAALRAWRSKQPETVSWQDTEQIVTPAAVRFVFSVHGDLGRELVPLLAARKGVSVGDVDQLKEPFLDAQHFEWMTSFSEFLWWFVRAGFADVIRRVGKGEGDHVGYPVQLRLTRSGVRVLDSVDEDHPSLPAFLDRVRERCPGLPDGVLSLLQDARSCLEHALLRPAVVLTGVAFELAIETVVDILATKGLVPPNTPKQLPAPRIAAVLAAIDTTGMRSIFVSADARTAATAAFDFADTLRLRRNEAAHTKPANDFSDRHEVDELLVSASRHLRALWSLAV